MPGVGFFRILFLEANNTQLFVCLNRHVRQRKSCFLVELEAHLKPEGLNLFCGSVEP